jgi:hypothetical protein
MTAFSLGGLSERLWSRQSDGSNTEKRFRGRKSTVEAIHRKRQSIDATMTRLLAEASEVQERWSHIQNARATIEVDKLTSVVARAQVMYSSLARTAASLDRLSIFGLNACNGDMQAAASFLAKLRMEVRASAARAIADYQEIQGFAFSTLRLMA